MGITEPLEASPASAPRNEPARKPRSWRRRAARWVVIVGGTYAAVCAALFVFQARMIYFPDRRIELTPADVRLPFESVTLQTTDGVHIRGWFVPCDPAKGVVLFLHGNAGNLTDVLIDVQEWRRLGYQVLAVDYRGFGESEGAPTEEGTYLDAEAAWSFLTTQKHVDPGRVVIHGRSLGGAVAIELARRHPPAALIVESTFTSLPDVGQVHYPLLPVHALARYRYDSVGKVSQLPCPKLFLHGRDDTLIPLAIGRRLFNAAASPKQFIETGGDHGSAGMFYDDASKRSAAAWLDQALASR